MPGWRSGNRTTFVRGLVHGFDKQRSLQRCSIGSAESTANGLGAGPMLPRARPSAAALVDPGSAEGRSAFGKLEKGARGSGYRAGRQEGSQV
jgi:hypothetical protein